MQQNYTVPVCTISNLKFEVLHNNKFSRPISSNYKTTPAPQTSSPSKHQARLVQLEGFIPINFTRTKNQLVNSMKLIKRNVSPLKGLDIEYKGFPVRKIKTSVSFRTTPAKKQKNYMLGCAQTPIFTNPKLSELIKTETREKEKIMNDYMSKSALQNYHSARSNQSARARKSIF